jgi:hypothetical protein
MKNFLKSLMENVWLVIIIVGIIVVLIGAAGGLNVKDLNLQVSDSSWRVAIVVFGCIITALGLCLLSWREMRRDKVFSNMKYGICFKIPDPTHKHIEYTDEVQILGGYKLEPPNKSLRLLVVSEDKSKYWPNRIVENFDEHKKEWSASVSLDTSKPGEEYGVLIVAALVGPAGKALWDYYSKVGNTHGVWEPLHPLPPDTIECAEVPVTKKS